MFFFFIYGCKKVVVGVRVKRKNIFEYEVKGGKMGDKFWNELSY